VGRRRCRRTRQGDSRIRDGAGPALGRHGRAWGGARGCPRLGGPAVGRRPPRVLRPRSCRRTSCVWLPLLLLAPPSASRLTVRDPADSE
jgi:hypothetical protein